MSRSDDMPRFSDTTAPAASAGDVVADRELVVMTADGVRTYPLPQRGVVTLGRAQGAGVVIPEPSVSRTHAAIQVHEPMVVTDLGSANGTRLGGRALVANQPAAFALGEPISLGDAIIIVRRGAQKQISRGAERTAPFMVGDGAAQNVVVKDDAMRHVYAMIERVGPSDLNVMILGETGAGKEVVATALHRASKRASGPFVKINCGAIPKHLVESELFGHEKGAFTGASQTRRGLLESGCGGTVFLDEVGELPLDVQVALLRAIEEREIRPVGARGTRKIDVRFVSATNRDLDRRMSAGEFRQDLFFRLNGMMLKLPPLRERRAEIPALAQLFAERMASQMGWPTPLLSAAVIDALLGFHWPGNVRQLRNVIERAVVLSSGGVIGVENLSLEQLDGGARLDTEAALSRATAVPPPLPPQRGLLERPRPRTLPPPLPQASTAGSDEGERARIEAALQQCSGNQTRAAQLLGISRRTLINRLDRFGMARPRKR